VFVTAISSHDVPARSPIQVAAGDRVSVGPRSPEWPAFVMVTGAVGEGWVPSRNLSAEEGVVTVEADYDTTELPVALGQIVEVLTRDDESGWWWCRSDAGAEGWVPRSVLTEPTV
jgi:hypothetical protein